ncbi:MAG: RluA family pseudouridine synthase [Planctomycetia bacterium]|nr:RluA family pseudouridine synthase [Planctomycetia bacterium]
MMSQRGFEILLEDDACLAVVKPSGVATQAPPGIDSLELRIKAYVSGKAESEILPLPLGEGRGEGQGHDLPLPHPNPLPKGEGTAQDAFRSHLGQRGQPSGEIYLGIPHRLDRPVSGAMIFAKTRRAARQFSKQFERRRVKKLYWAAVERVVEPLEGTWTDYLWKIYGQPRALLVEHTHPEGQEAILHYRTLGFHSSGSWLEIELATGRTHQVRVQTSSRGYPILGDAHYGSRIPFGPQHEDPRLRAIALHARTLTFFHPTTREQLTLDAPLSDAWSELELKPRT